MAYQDNFTHLSQINHRVGQKQEIPQKKTPDHLQAELGLSHMTQAMLEPTVVR